MKTSGFRVTVDQALYASLFSGALASGAIALFFLLVDSMQGRPLFTPSLVANVVLLGAVPSEVGSVRLDLVALYSLTHFILFALLGTAATLAYLAASPSIRHPLVLGSAVYASMGAGVWIADIVAFPGLLLAIGPGALVVANALAAIVMAWFIHAATAEARAELTARSRSR